MSTTKRLGWRCKCGTLLRLGGGGVETTDQLEAWRDKKRQENWSVMVVHPEAVDGCGAAMWLQADDVILIDIQTRESGEDHP